MKPWCVGHHCVVIQSPPPPNHVCAPWCGLMCDGSCMTNGVCVVVEGDWWHLWLVAWLCHPHLCLFAIHHKWHSPHMPTFCCTTPKWMARGPGDLPSCIGWLFCDHSFSFPFPTTIVSSSFSNHPFFSRPLLHACLEILFWMHLMVPVSASFSFFSFQWFMV